MQPNYRELYYLLVLTEVLVSVDMDPVLLPPDCLADDAVPNPSDSFSEKTKKEILSKK